MSHQCCSSCEIAAGKGHFECLCNARKRGLPWGRTCEYAASNGHLKILRYAFKHGAPLNAMVCTCAAMSGYLKCLRYAHKHGAPWNKLATMCAASKGHLKILRYAHEHGAPWHQDACKFAALNGYTKCLHYAFLCGAPWPEAPARLVVWRDRVRGTAGAVLDKWRIVREQAARTIQEAALPFIHRPGGLFMLHGMERFFEEVQDVGLRPHATQA